jgi:hypothetical protein
LPLPILNMRVPQTGHSPSVAGRPFFIVICLGFFISRCSLHFMQRACIVILPKVFGRHRGP